jgi:hypothetical protein
VLSTAIKLNVGLEVSSIFLTFALLGGDRSVSYSGLISRQIELWRGSWNGSG